ncbi:MAG: ankyrin repeat domain-containing protein [Tepidiformaceae bacterium]
MKARLGLILASTGMLVSCSDGGGGESASSTPGELATRTTAVSAPATQPPAAPSQSATPLGDRVELIEAARTGDAPAVRDLLARGANVNVRAGDGLTPVMAAARDGHVETVRLLTAAGGDVNAKDSTLENAFSIAAINNHVEVLRLTIAAGADVNAKNRFNGTALIAASDRGNVEVVRELLTTKIDVDHVNRLGWTALLEAIILGDGGSRHTEIVQLLVTSGASVTIADASGVTPLQHSRSRGYATIVEILQRAGAR